MNIEKILYKKIEVWLVLLISLAWFVLMILFGSAVKDSLPRGSEAGRIGKMSLELASVPGNLKVLIEKGMGIEFGKLVQKNTQILKQKNSGNYTLLDESYTDDGILLVSAYSKKNAVSTVYLYDLRDGKVLWEWVPEPEKIIEKAPELMRSIADNKDLLEMQTRTVFRSQHPFLLADGSIVLTSGDGPLTRLNACGEIEWTVDRQFHHSIQKVKGGFIAPVVSIKNKDNKISKDFRDDGYAIVSEGGVIQTEESIIDILLEHGYEGLLFGQTVRGDRIHLNDAEVIAKDDNFVKAGDIMFSARNISTVFLYRPAEHRILWLKTGPWLSQHDVDYLGNGRFSIFGNDVDASGGDYLGREYSNIYIYDMKDNSVSKPYDKVFRANKLLSGTQGVQRILDNGDVFFEMSNQGEIYRASPDRLRWKYVHSLGDAEIGATHWSRYFKRDELNLDWQKKINCIQKKG